MFWAWAPRSRFYRQLASLVRSGVALDIALPLAGDAAGGTYVARSRAWARGCAGGQPLSSQLHDEPPTAVALVRAGEHTGRLPDVCEAIADLTDHARQLRSTLLGRLWYPAMLLHAALLAPGLPGAVMGTGSVLGLLTGPLVFWSLVALAFLGWKFGLTAGIIGRVALIWPLRPLVLPLLADRVCLIAGAAHGAGLLHRPALEMAAGACGNQTLATALQQAARDVDANRLTGLAPALAQAGLDPTTVALVQAGEAGGRLTEGFNHAARHNRQAFALRADMTVRIGSGLIYALVTLMAAFTVVSMYQNIYGEALKAAEIDAN